MAGSLASLLLLSSQAQGADAAASSSLRVGLVGCPQDTGGSLAQGPAAVADQLRISVTHVWDADKARASDYAKRNGIPNVVDRPAAMVNAVDGVLLCDQLLLPWHPQILSPMLEAGVPVWVDGAIASSMSAARTIIDSARRGNTALAAATTEEFLPLTTFLRRKLMELAPITGGMAVVSTTGRAENRWTGSEGVGLACAIFGTGATKVCRVAASTTNPNYSITLQYDELAEKRPVHVVVSGLPDGADRVWARIYGLSGDGMVDRSHPRYDESGQEWLNSLLPAALEMQKMFATKQPPQDYAYLLDKTRIYLASCQSTGSPDGRQAVVSELAETWELENAHPGYVPGGILA